MDPSCESIIALHRREGGRRYIGTIPVVIDAELRCKTPYACIRNEGIPAPRRLGSPAGRNRLVGGSRHRPVRDLSERVRATEQTTAFQPLDVEGTRCRAFRIHREPTP